MRRILHDAGMEGQELIPIEFVPDSSDPREMEIAKIANQEIHQAALQAIRWLLTYLAKYRRPAIAIDALAFATGLMILNPGASETAIADKHQVSRQAFSKLVTKISKELHLTPSRGMKSLKARESYRKCQLKGKT
jgi:hypothetical protein